MVGQRIRDLRGRKKLSQLGLAEKAKLSQPCISDIENGHASPNLTTLNKIAKALGISTKELIEDDSEESLVSLREDDESA